MRAGTFGSGLGWVGLFLFCAAGAFGCAASSQTGIRHDLEVMKEESTADRLAERGEAFAAVGDMTRAEQYFVAALRAGGEPRSLSRRLIAACSADGRYPAALQHAEEYLEKHPNDVAMRYVAATLRLAIGDTQGARDSLKRVLVAEADFADAHWALAQLDTQDGDVMAADTHYRAYLRVTPSGAHAEVARANLMRTVGTP